jgi:PilZ domain
MTHDQRRDRRILTRQKLWREGQEEAPAETRDMSQNGMFIVAEDAPEVGSQLKVTFNDAEGEATLNLEVMWRGAKDEDNRTGIGVRIVGFDKGKDVYEKFISRHLRSDSRAPQGTLRPAAAASKAPPGTSERPKSG